MPKEQVAKKTASKSKSPLKEKTTAKQVAKPKVEEPKKQVKPTTPRKGKVEEESKQMPTKKGKNEVPQALQVQQLQPKKPSSAYLFFNTEYVKKLKEENPAVEQSECFKLAGTKWSTMVEKDKKPYEAMAEKDKQRYEKDTQMLESKGYFIMPDKSKSTDPANAHLIKKKKAKADTVESEPEDLQPKRVISAYMFFNTKFSAQIRESKPGETLSMGVVSKAVSEKWNAMTEEEKAPFEQLSLKDAGRRDKQLAELTQKGYFTLEDGSKSTDEKNVPKKRKSMKATKSMLDKSKSEEELKTQKPRKTVKEVKEAVAKGKK